MTAANPPEGPWRELISKAPATPAPSNPIPSSSPAFATPAHPIRPFNASEIPPKTSILPIILPPQDLRSLAFRTFTKKHRLTLSSSALQVLATFIGRYCGTGWREEGLAEKVLEDVAKSWKGRSGGVIVDGESSELKDILKNLEGSMSKGRIVVPQDGFVLGSSQNGEASHTRPSLRPTIWASEESRLSLSTPAPNVEEEAKDGLQDPRKWMKVINAFEQPRLVYNVGKKRFDRDPSKPSFFPHPSLKTQLFRNRYNLVHQRLLRNESFQTLESKIPTRHPKRPSAGLGAAQQPYKLTPIANLLGRNRSSHTLLGLLTISPTGTLAINDLTGSVSLDLTHAKPVPEDGAWFSPGMIVLVDGTYEDDNSNASTTCLGGSGGIGGTIGGKFMGIFISGPKCERRQVTLGLGSVHGEAGVTAGADFGRVDFLGVGSERAVGPRLRNLEERFIRRPTADDESGPKKGRMVILGEVSLDQLETVQALRKVMGIYAAEPEGDTPIIFILKGNFVSHAALARCESSGSIEYKECFNNLASTLSDYPTLLQSAAFVFVPGDNDAWASSFSAGAATALPRKGIPEIFTSRVNRAFATANAEAEKGREESIVGEAIWTTNPSRISLFGLTHEILLFRDGITGRLRRTAIRFPSFSQSGGDGDEDVDMEMANTPPVAPEENGDVHTDSNTQTTDSHVIETSLEDAIPRDLHVARKLVKAILEQGYLSPFEMATRPVLWDYASSLQLYPLPTAMVLTDTEAPAFAITYEGCHVMNPGSLVAPGKIGAAQWVEYDIRKRVGTVKELLF